MPHFPRLYIEHFTRPGQVVLDPMCGSGTTLIEAAVQGRRGIGVDIDPMACLIARVSTTPLAATTLDRVGDGLAAAFAAALARGDQHRVALPPAAAFPNQHLWFRPEVLCELVLMRDLIRAAVPDPEYRDFALLCLSSIVRECSNADPRDIFPERDQARPLRERQDVGRAFAAAWQAMSARLAAFTAAVSGQRRVEVESGDARCLNLCEAADFFFTSPPYAYALDYARVHQLSTWLLLMDNATLRQHRRRYIGTDRLSARTRLTDWSGLEFARAAIEQVYAADRKWGLVLHSYLLDMLQVTRRLYAALRPGGQGVYVVGNSTIKGTPFQTAAVLQRFCATAGLEPVQVLERPYYVYRMARRRNSHSNTIKSDLFIRVRKPGRMV